MKTNGPWQIVATQEKYKNPWLRVYEDQVIHPDGNPGIFGVVEMVAGVSVLVIDDDDSVYLTREHRYGLGCESLEVVSGAVDQGETPLQAAQRELQEELGIVAEEWLCLGLVNPFTSTIKSPATLFVAKKLKWTEAKPEGSEIIQMVKMSFAEAVDQVMQSKITHGPSCVLILKMQCQIESHCTS